MKIVLLAPLYLPPTDYFRHISDADMAVIDTHIPFDKRKKDIHRTVISRPDFRGTSFLTVPLSKKTFTSSAHSVCVDAHGEWWRVQNLTLATLFGPTPWFKLLHPDFAAVINQSAVGRPITDVDLELIAIVCRIAGVNTPLSDTLDPRYLTDPNVKILDMRQYDFYGNPGCVSVIETLFKNGRL